MVGPVVALVTANGQVVGVRLLHVVPQVGQVGRPVAAGVADQVLALVVHGLDVVLEEPVAGGRVVALRAGVVPDVVVDHLDVLLEVALAPRLEAADVADEVLDLVVDGLDVLLQVARVVSPEDIFYVRVSSLNSDIFLKIYYTVDCLSLIILS